MYEAKLEFPEGYGHFLEQHNGLYLHDCIYLFVEWLFLLSISDKKHIVWFGDWLDMYVSTRDCVIQMTSLLTLSWKSMAMERIIKLKR